VAQDDISFSILGLKELNNTLGQLGPAYKYKGARFALRKAANLVRDAAKQNALRLDDPETASAIAENIAVRFSSRRFKNTGDVMFRVGVRGGAKQEKNQSVDPGLPGGGTQHWRFPEFGYIHKKSGEHVPPTPFMRPALEENIDKAVGEFVDQLDKWTARNLKKLQKQGAIK